MDDEKQHVSDAAPLPPEGTEPPLIDEVWRSQNVQSVERAFTLLEYIAKAQGELSLAQLSALVGLTPPTAHRLLRTMAAMGYIKQLPSRRYGLGIGLMRLGRHAATQLSPFARPRLAELSDALGQTTNLAMLDDDRVIYIAQAPAAHAVRTFTKTGYRTYAHSTAVGKAILAQLDDEHVRRIVARTGLPRATDRTITDPAALFAELETVRWRGYAVDDGEHEPGVRCYAVAVPTEANVPVHTALSVSGPEVGVTAEFGDRAVSLLEKAASALSAEIQRARLP